MTQLIALIHISAELKVQLRVTLPITSISQIDYIIVGEILAKFLNLADRISRQANQYTVNCILVTKIKTQLYTVM